MKVKVIASGSKGNCTYVECGTTKFLIDMGINFVQLSNSLNEIGIKVNDISFILITHIHTDHIKGLQSLLKKTNITMYSSTGIYEYLSKKIEIKNFHIIDKYYMINGIDIEQFPLSHDVECYGFLIKFDNRELVYITDTGYLNKRYYDILKNKDIYIIESNHDEKMLMDGPYPYILKQRIVSDKGHLSNSTTAKILKKIIGNKTKYVFLAHISEHNNTKELAFNQVCEQLKDNNFDLNNLLITDQYISMEIVEV